MSREIKFRAHWNGSIYDITDIGFEFGRAVLYNPDTDCETEVDLDGIDLLQYTGLKDRNGTEIYEGDIVECEPSDMFRPPYKAPVKMTSKGYWTPLVRVREGYNCIDRYSPEAFEIVGNIHENPDIL